MFWKIILGLVILGFLYIIGVAIQLKVLEKRYGDSDEG